MATSDGPAAAAGPADGRAGRRTSRPAPPRDPLAVHAALRDAGADPWTLLSAGAHPEARQSIVAWGEDARLEIRGDRATWTGRGGPRSGPALDMLADFVRLVADRPGSVGFDGGIVGWFGAECAALWEPTLPDTAPDAVAESAPDAVLRLCETAYVLDHENGTAHLHAPDADEAARWHDVLEKASHRPYETRREVQPGDVEWRTSLDRAAFMDAVGRVRDLVAAGDIFQANIATCFTAPCTRDPLDLLAALRDANPSPYMALLPDGWGTIVSGSPELLFATQHGRLRARPIAGTRPRGDDEAADGALEQELLHDPKELAEHTMLVDLARNDVARVAVPGTVRVAERTSVERYLHVMHLVSRVEGDMRPGTGAIDRLGALFPGGTVTGAPKPRATRRIMETEPVRRGPYTGSAGFLAYGGDSCWNILIRTIVLQDGQAHIHAGSGIVADSDPAREWEEAGHKARALLEAAGGTPGRRSARAQHRTGAGGRHRLGAVTRHGDWAPPAAPATFPSARVLLVDNEDSFVWNLADYCAALGAQVEVVRHDAGVEEALVSFQPTHVILSPGPGRPEEVPTTMGLARDLVGRLPVLGVCLGHQAMAAAHGASVVAGAPVHGKAARVHHDGGLWTGLPSPFVAARYHSLHVDRASLGPEWIVDAWLEDGTVMAMRHRDHPAYGLQFHPESLCTEHGVEIVARFLGSAP